MKLHLKRRRIFTFSAANALRMLAVAALLISATCLSALPVRAQIAPVTLQCQVSINGTGYALACNGAIPDGSGVLDCQSPNVISDNRGVIAASQVTCTGTGMLAGITIPGALTAAVLAINTNDGSLSISQGAGTLTVQQGLSTLTGTCQGAALSASLSPPALNVPDGACQFTLNVLGVGAAQLGTQNGSIGVVNGSTLSIDSPTITLTASLLGLPVTTATCGNTIAISLRQLPSISELLTLCKGS